MFKGPGLYRRNTSIPRVLREDCGNGAFKDFLKRMRSPIRRTDT